MEQTLAALREGENGIVTALRMEGAFRKRMQDIGLIDGTSVRCLHRNSSGSIAAYHIRGAVIALRRQDAQRIGIASVK